MAPSQIEFFRHKAFDRSLDALYKAGGEKKRRAEKVHALLGRLQIGLSAFDSLPKTNHGESRIQHCIKFDLGSGFRLVTIHHDRLVAFLFVGTHEEVDRWLDGHSGLTITRGKSGSWEPVFKSETAESLIRRAPVGGKTTLLERLSQDRVDQLLGSVTPTVMRGLFRLGAGVSTVELETVCQGIVDSERRMLVYDVLSHLASGDRAAAESRLDLALGEAQDFNELSPADVLEVEDGDTIRRLRVGTKEYGDWLNRFSRQAEPHEWLLFLNPEQSRVVAADFNGPSQLSGVSGSGKTCVAIHRALRLATERPDSTVLVVTLNRALAGLIRSLVDSAAPSEAVAKSIGVKSFFQLCQDLLKRFEPENIKLYDDVTWKLGEHIDEVFREYYRCWANNHSAEEMLPVHHSLVAQGICAETYLREEFDWIRSALPVGDRQGYLTLERAGRRTGLLQEPRARLLRGLDRWEQKMRDVGVIDYLGLTAALTAHLSSLEPEYDHIIIDEAQDFGTAELKILRALCRRGPNDLFLCGDIAQHVLPKHRSLADAGISTAKRTCRIVRNYRNTREILEAAYAVLMENLDEHLLDSADLEILDPKYASRSSNEPVVLEADSLEAEIGYARSLANEHLHSNHKHRCCIALAGYTIREVATLAERLGLPVLRGERGPMNEPLVLSDLEQTKGYEFNLVIIVNCREGVLPPEGTAPEESFRHGCRLYVAMTRARDELVLSYHDTATTWLTKTSKLLTFLPWEDVVALDHSLIASPPERLRETEPDDSNALNLTGRQFLYTPHARGLSLEAIRKIDELVDGIGLIRNQTRVKWINMATLLEDLERPGKAQQILGSVVQKEVRERLKLLAASRRESELKSSNVADLST